MRRRSREQDAEEASSEQVFRTPIALIATKVFLTTLAVQADVGLVWPPTADIFRWFIFSTVFTVGYVFFWRPWLRVGSQGLRAGHGPITREKLALDGIFMARPHNTTRRPGRAWWRRDPREVDMHPGWGPAVVVERVDGSRIVVGVPDAARALSALDEVGVPVSHRSG